ncbi:hypothetical protein BJX70DRAFT_136912 [Aspergillus crustosus]
MDQPAEPTKRRRLGQPRSKTGCRTCRTRHVKCDEAPGACRRCVTSGYKCDGYDVERLPQRRNAKQIARTALTEYQFRALLPGKTSEERRFFNYFHCFTIPMLSGWFDHRMWNSLILQMCESEPAICHAVVALSALQEVSEAAGQSVLPEDMSNRTHRFALYQYNRSIEHLRGRMGSQDPNVRSTVLLCCLLFIAFELLRGNNDKAVAHLQSGINVLGVRDLDYHALYRQHPAVEQDIEHSVTAALVHLDCQVVHFGLSETHKDIDFSTLAHAAEHGIWPTRPRFHCIQDACFLRDRTLIQYCLFDTFCESLSEEDVIANYPLLSAEQQRLQLHMHNFGLELDDLETRLSQEQLTDRARASLELLHMHQLGVLLLIDVCLIKSKETIRTNFAHRFAEIVDFSEKIIAGIQQRSRESGHRPTLMMETGVVGPLYYVIFKCQDPALTQRALALLESWPHREGMWDSDGAAVMARATLEGPGPGLEPELASRMSMPVSVSGSNDSGFDSGGDLGAGLGMGLGNECRRDK